MIVNICRALFFYCFLGVLCSFSTPTPNRIRVGLSGFPSSNLFYLGFDDYSEAVSTLVLEPLVRLNPDTLKPEPALASHFSNNASLTRFTFELNPQAHFSDGSSVTAEDVKFTWDLLQKTGRQVSAYIAQFSNLKNCTIETPSRITFTSDLPYASGVAGFSQLFILPKKHFAQGNFLKDFNETFLGSGPYVFQNVQWGKSISLVKNKNYWARAEASKQGKYSFDYIEFQVHSDPMGLLKLLLTQQIDYLYFLSAKSWAKDTQSELFTDNKIKKLEVINEVPFAMAGIAWNLRKPLFQDVRVRQALALLFNRPRLIQDFFFNQYQLATGIANFRTPYHHPRNEPIPYNPGKAQELLKQAGWSLSSKKRLEKNQIPFSFEILTGNAPAAKFLAVYQEDLRKVGIQASIRVVDWASYIRLRNAGDFDAIDFSRNRDEAMRDLEMTWHSSGAFDPRSGNVTGFQDKEVDLLLNQLKTQTQETLRRKIIQDLDLRIAQAFPLAFSWEPKSQRIAYWNHLGFKNPGYHRFSRWNQLFQFWNRTDEKTGS